jgi:hypothetical protein
MSLLNLTNDGLPNILVVLYATLAEPRSRLTSETLLERVAPKSVVKDPKLARTTLNRWIELGLFREAPDSGELSLFEEPATSMKNEVEIVRAVRMAARRIALAEENNADLWAAEGARAADLSRSLAWLLAQDVYRIGGRNLFTLANDHVVGTGKTLIQNESRASGLKAWGCFLGFIRHSGDVEVDPTVSIAEILPECIAPGDGMPARDFVERLAKSLPVIDGGVYRRAVQARLRADALPILQADQLSASLSRALFGFMIDKTLQFTSRADVGSGIVLTGRDGLRTDQRFTWVKCAL